MDIALVKTILGFIAIVLTFAGYIPYFKDIVKGKTKPHLYSWFLWFFVTTIIFALQYTGGAGIGSFVTLTVALMCAVVIGLSLKYGVNRDVKPVDAIFIVLAFVALGLWLIAKQPVLSTILSTAIDLFGFAPTIRKSWNHPHTETLSFYTITSLRFAITILALSQYTIVTALYPVAWLFGNGLFAIMLFIRRRQIVR